MTRDFSQFLGNTAAPAPKLTPLQLLGWQPFFAQQTDTDEMVETPPVRITEVHRNGLHAIGDGIDEYIAPVERATVGDWFLLNRDFPSKSRLLERKSLIKRRAAGHDRTVQFIAANLDTAFIVTSCNADFNVARLERYIALALDADVDPVIILTKSDMADDPETYAETARQISDLVPVVTLDARADEPKEKLAQWCKPGKTVGFIGSSGVGKSTLTNALSGTQDIETADIREDDARGRHTTTRRQLHFIPNSCAVLDTPGMRELQLTDVASGVAELFADLEDLSHACKFRDCAHETEPGCAIKAAIEAGDIDAPRLARWKKLVAEDHQNTTTLAQRKARDKTLGKTINAIQKNNKK
jgi:ribosome biogenesis GTPase